MCPTPYVYLMMSAITAFLTSLPELIKLGREIFAWVKKVSGDDPVGFIKQLNEVFSQINKATTTDEKQKAAKDLHDLITKL